MIWRLYFVHVQDTSSLNKKVLVVSEREANSTLDSLEFFLLFKYPYREGGNTGEGTVELPGVAFQCEKGWNPLSLNQGRQLQYEFHCMVV